MEATRTGTKKQQESPTDVLMPVRTYKDRVFRIDTGQDLYRNYTDDPAELYQGYLLKKRKVSDTIYTIT